MLAVSCGPNKQAEQDKITEMQSKLYKDESNVSNMDVAKKLDEAYKAYFTKYEDDSMSCIYLFADARLQINSFENTQAAKELFLELVQRCPDSHLAPNSLFAVAYDHEQKNELDSARKYYNKFIKDYPRSHLVNDARISLMTLGKDLNEVIKEFEAQDSTRNIHAH